MQRAIKTPTLSIPLVFLLTVVASLAYTATAAFLPANVWKFSEGFSAYQGQNQWRFQFRVGSSYVDMTWDQQNSRWKGNETYLLIGRGWLHPGESGDVALKWVAPMDGVINIVGVVSDIAGNCGDGVRATILKNDTIIWGSWRLDNGDSAGKTHDVFVDVLAGDGIYFIVDNRGGNNDCDTTGWDPTISYPDGAIPTPLLASVMGDSHIFSIGFTSTQGKNHWFYKQWNGADYTDMVWDAIQNRWRGERDLCLIGRGWAHPDDNCEAVIAWQAPVAGDVVIQGHIERLDTRGDGTQTKIMTDHVQLWPPGGWQMIWPGFMVQHVVETHVNAGDFLYFHVNAYGANNSDTTAWNLTINYNDHPAFTLGPVELVMDRSTMRRLGFEFVDSSLSTVYQGNVNHWYHSNGYGEHQKFSGPLHEPGQIEIYNKTDNNFFTSNPDNADGMWWLNNIYRAENGDLLGFIHTEKAGNGRKFRISLAYSTDNGDTWMKLGHIIQPFGDPDDLNVTGAPYLIKDGYFYVYYLDTHGEAVARAQVSEVLAAAQNGRTTTWWKYYNGNWSEPGLGGNSTRLGMFGALHSDAAYSTVSRQYILTGYEHGVGRGVWIAFSTDGVTWSERMWIQRGSQGNTSLSPYETIVNADGTDNAQVGQSFYLYWAFNPDWDATQNDDLMFIYRQKVTLRQQRNIFLPLIRR